MSIRIALPDAPAVVAGHGRAAILTADGEFLLLSAADAAAHLRNLPPPLLLHAPATFRRLGLRPGPAFDLLELFAFVLPARTAAPTPRGLALALDHPMQPNGLEAEAALLPDLAAALLNRLAQGRATPLNRDAPTLAARMGAVGWGWTPYVLAALDRADAVPTTDALKVWRRLPEWEDAAPLPPPSALPVTEAEARARLAAMLGPDAEQRPAQSDYAGAAAAAFAPRETRGDPELRAGRGRHRHRQDARLPRPSQRLGPEEPRHGVGQHLHPPPAAPDRRRDSPACSPTRSSAAAAWSSARAARTTCAC